MNRRVLAAACAGSLIAGVFTVAFAGAQTEPAPEPQYFTVCPVVTNPQAGMAVSCTVEARTPTTTPPVTTTTTTVAPTTTEPTTTTSLVPPITTTTTTQPPAEPAVGSDEWKATTGLTSPVELLSTVNGSVTTAADNQTIVDKRITGDLVVNHANVTVINSRIMGVVRGSNLRNLTLRNVDLGRASCPSGTNGGTRLISGGNYTLENSRLHHNGADLVNLAAGSITMRNSWLGNTCYYNGDHLDAIQMYNPGQNVTLLVEKSFLDSRAVNASAKGNGAVFIADNPGAQSRFTFKGNLFAGGNHNVTWFYDRGVFEVRDNVYVAASWSAWSDPQYNDRTPCDTNVSITFTGNTLDNGTPVSC